MAALEGDQQELAEALYLQVSGTLAAGLSNMSLWGRWWAALEGDRQELAEALHLQVRGRVCCLAVRPLWV